MSYPLVNLHPYTEYKITVRCMPKQGGFWSEGKSKNGTTKEAGKCNGHVFVYYLSDFKLSFVIKMLCNPALFSSLGTP